MDVSDESRRTATYLRDALAVRCEVHQYWDEKEESSAYILSAQEAPGAGLATYATVSLSDHPTGLNAYDVPLRVEVLFATWSNVQRAPNILSTCVFNAVNSGWPVTLNSVHRSVVRMYYPSLDMAHAILVSPFSFKLETQRLPNRTVAWLQLLPISDAELTFAEGHGVDALEKRLQAVNAHAFDLNRPSIF